jgi:putative membrane protein
MSYFKNFIKGMVAGVGGIVPGLSGSVLMVLLDIYEHTVRALGTLFQNFKKNVRFLLPVLLGMVCGVLLFSRVVDFLLMNFAFATRYAFLGLVLGTVPLFYHQIGKHGFPKYCYAIIFASVVAGFLLLGFNRNLFAPVTEPNFLQSMLMGLIVAASSIVPGVDSAVILSTFGFYELYVGSLAELNLVVLLPAGLGLALGAVVISAIMHLLLKKAYTITFSVLFGLFLAMIPNVLDAGCRIATVLDGLIAFAFVLAGFLVSYFLGDWKANTARLKVWLARFKQ